MNKKLFIIAILITCIVFNCKKDPREIAKTELEKQMEPSRLKLTAYKNQPIYWTATHTEKDQCVIAFLETLSKGNKPTANDCLIEKREWEESFLPYVFGQGTLLDSTPLEKYLEITEERKDIGLEKITSILINKKYKITSIKWNKNEKSNLQPFVGWKPVIHLLINRNTFVINEIKQVIEYKGTYRIAVIAP